MEEWIAGLRLRFQPVGLTGRRVEPTPRRARWTMPQRIKPVAQTEGGQDLGKGILKCWNVGFKW